MKAIFLLLNAVLGVAFLVIFLTPLFLVGGDWFSLFWVRNWPIAVVFAVTLAAIDAYFLFNWKLFTGLEKENWAEVAGFLEDRILRRGWITSGRVRLLLNTYLVTSNTEGILALEAYLAEKRPALLARFSLPFGIPHLLSKDSAASEAWFHAQLERPRLADRDWTRWNHAFCLLQARKSDEARAILGELIDQVSDPVLLLLSIYLLEAIARPDAAMEARVTARRESLRGSHTPSSIQKAIEKSSANIQVVVLSRLLQDATQWLFAGPAIAAEDAVRGTDTVQ
jgi:hypothetical protein